MKTYLKFPKHTRLKDPKAIKAARRDRCELCGNTWMLQVHHIKHKASGGDDEPRNLICLCAECHTKVHCGEISRHRIRSIVKKREGLH
jgi:5-methylcytosine-specific restriction endonuclease McrA